jgi:KDO2-lipid IV(A) lauroyltransferase
MTRLTDLRRKTRSLFEIPLMYLGIAIVPLLPRAVVVGLAVIFGEVAFLVSRRTRRISRANLGVAFGDRLTPAEKRRIARASCRSLARVALDLFWFSRWTRKRITKYVAFDSSCDQTFRARPAISVGGHLGNWEMLGQAVALKDPPLLGIAAHLKNSTADSIVSRLRKGGNQQVVYKEGAARASLKMLKTGGRVGLLLDQNVLPSEGGIFVEFFGLKVPMSSVAETLARRTGAPLAFGFCIPDGKGHYTVHSRELLTIEDSPGEGELTQKIADILQEEVSRNPAYWVWMYKRWKLIPEGESPAGYPYYARPIRPLERRL